MKKKKEKTKKNFQILFNQIKNQKPTKFITSYGPPKFDVPGIDIYGPKIDAGIRLPGVDLSGPKIDAGLDIKKPKIDVSEIDICGQSPPPFRSPSSSSPPSRAPLPLSRSRSPSSSSSSERKKGSKIKPAKILESSSNIESSSSIDLSREQQKKKRIWNIGPEEQRQIDEVINIIEKKKTKIEIDDIQGLGPDAQRISQEVREVIEKIERRKKDEKIKILKKQNAELRKILKEKNEIIISLRGNKNIIKKSVINIKK